MVLKLVSNKFLIAGFDSVSYTHLRAHETEADLVCRLLLEKKTNAASEVIAF